jgi:hypothetical protein
MNIALLAVPLLFAGHMLAAEPDRISLLMGSHHIDAKTYFNEVNPGVFVSWDRVTLGLYENSYGRTSVAAAYAFPILRRPELEVDLFAGVALYPEDGRRFAIHAGDWVPMAGIEARSHGLFVQIIPSDGVWTDAIIGFGITKDF